MRPRHEHPLAVLAIACAIGLIVAFLVDSAGLVVLAMLEIDRTAGPDTVFGAHVPDVETYVHLGAFGIGLLAASGAWRLLRPRHLHELREEGEPERVR